MLLVFGGAVVTVLITALLLNQQTELELRKEGQVLLPDRKSAIYAALIDHVGEIVEKGRLDADLEGDGPGTWPDRLIPNRSGSGRAVCPARGVLKDAAAISA